jgi:protein-S-isoprenylcysteine O-methyltransferase Ste14
MPAWLIVIISCAVVLVGSVGFLAVKSREPKEAVESNHWSSWLVWITGLSGLAVTLWEWSANNAWAVIWSFLVPGVILIAGGLTIRVMARLALGRYYSPQVCILEGHRLVTEGIYGRIRHPGYLGFLMLAVGVSLAFASWAGLAVMLAGFLPSLLYRISREEALLGAHFGAAYEEYAARTQKLIPSLF